MQFSATYSTAVLVRDIAAVQWWLLRVIPFTWSLTQRLAMCSAHNLLSADKGGEPSTSAKTFSCVFVSDQFLKRVSHQLRWDNFSVSSLSPQKVMKWRLSTNRCLPQHFHLLPNLGWILNLLSNFNKLRREASQESAYTQFGENVTFDYFKFAKLRWDK